MKVLLLRLDGAPRSKEALNDIYVNIVTEIRTNAIAMIPQCVRDVEVVDIDAVAYENSGRFLVKPSVIENNLRH